MMITFNCKRDNKMCPVYKGVGYASSLSPPLTLDGNEWLAACPSFFTLEYTHQIMDYMSPRTCMDSGEERIFQSSIIITQLLVYKKENADCLM